MAVKKTINKKQKCHSNQFPCKATISEAANELIPLTAPRNSSSSIDNEVQQLSGQHFPRKIEMVLKKVVVLKNRVGRSCKVSVPTEYFMATKAGDKHKCPGQETSYACAQCCVTLCSTTLF